MDPAIWKLNTFDFAASLLNHVHVSVCDVSGPEEHSGPPGPAADGGEGPPWNTDAGLGPQ